MFDIYKSREHDIYIVSLWSGLNFIFAGGEKPLEPINEIDGFLKMSILGSRYTLKALKVYSHQMIPLPSR